MASTVEMFLAGLALLVNTFCITVMFFVGNIIVAPILNALTALISTQSAIPMSDMTYIIPSIWGILLIDEIIIIIACFVVIGRRQDVSDWDTV